MQEKRQLIHFSALGIPHLYSLGKVELSAHTQQRLLRHVHPDQFEVCFHYDGHQQYEVEGVQYTTQSGDLFITRPNERHGSGDCGEEKSKLFYLIFELTPETQQFMGLPAELSDYIRDTLCQLHCRHIQGAHTIHPLLQKVFELYDQPDPFRAERIRGIMVEFFYQLTGYIRRHPLPGSMDGSIAIVVRRISDAPGEAWTDQNMADLSGLSLSYFKRKFKQQTGFAPHDYLLRMRVKTAKQLLASSALTVTEIAGLLGFSSSQHFAASFKLYEGKTPTQYCCFAKEQNGLHNGKGRAARSRE